MAEKTSKPSAKTEIAPPVKVIELGAAVSVKELADSLDTNPVEVIKALMRKGIMANINQVIDFEVAKGIVEAAGFEAKLKILKKSAAKKVSPAKEKLSNFPLRPPVVTIMGHVDHGKTRLLDAIRSTNVMEKEAGGITQHIGAYQVEIKGQKITFLDTPGHEAFTAMRARGAQATDITILVVAADDGVMPQTLEALDHAKAAGVPIILAINKMDKPEANPDRVKQQLAEAGLVVEEWGGDTLAIPTSAREKKGINELLEAVLLIAELEDLRADPNQPANGVVIEAEMDKTKGPMATVLVQSGTLKLGDTVVAGNTWGRVKAMFNDVGKRIKKAEPSTPVALLGMENVPQVGDKIIAVATEKQARDMVNENSQVIRKINAVSLTNVYDQVSKGNIKELNIILKTDVQGSLEPIKDSLEKLGTDKIKININRSGVGNITESDVMLAMASGGLIIGFSTGIETNAQRLADAEDIDIRHYDIIYKLVEDVEKALQGLLEPTLKEVIDGRAEVRAVFESTKKLSIAGCMVLEGKLTKNSQVRLLRGGEVIVDAPSNSLRRFKDDVKEVVAGYECGVGLKDFNEFQKSDILEFYHKEKSR
ncbi:translation initiation factor IF-2 [Dehalococcoides mccartyi]|uniref:Translation initiation factor IF-2 n=1 Tax=Dehalococcoides mccartyi (strain VS) TaxID=311424 RepID=D2BI33_DEHMV|nr:translation initiation factor IF-2 [Dehalococcoides mccartyi]ACZ61983.1 translation initiation factor 2 (IF-2) [Dehalococcoides mccartyi VS]